MARADNILRIYFKIVQDLTCVLSKTAAGSGCVVQTEGAVQKFSLVLNMSPQ